MGKVLIIEDNFEIRDNAVELLALEGYDVIGAKDGKVGLEMVRLHRPAVILCDIMMPEMDGYQVLEALKKEKLTPEIPFVFVTASVEPKEIQAALSLGAQAYLRKPFDEDELLELVARYVKKA